jgi:acylphosphatase
MPLIELFQNFRDKYMRSALEKMEFPEFPPDIEKRYQIIFSGIVQGVGFRYEAWLVAQKLGLTGFAENLPNGDVRMEIQGPKNRILHLIHCMESIPRISITNKVIKELMLKEEKGFTPVY